MDKEEVDPDLTVPSPTSNVATSLATTADGDASSSSDNRELVVQSPEGENGARITTPANSATMSPNDIISDKHPLDTSEQALEKVGILNIARSGTGNESPEEISKVENLNVAELSSDGVHGAIFLPTKIDRETKQSNEPNLTNSAPPDGNFEVNRDNSGTIKEYRAATTMDEDVGETSGTVNESRTSTMMDEDAGMGQFLDSLPKIKFDSGPIRIFNRDTDVATANPQENRLPAAKGVVHQTMEKLHPARESSDGKNNILPMNVTHQPITQLPEDEQNRTADADEDDVSNSNADDDETEFDFDEEDGDGEDEEEEVEIFEVPELYKSRRSNFLAQNLKQLQNATQVWFTEHQPSTNMNEQQKLSTRLFTLHFNETSIAAVSQWCVGGGEIPLKRPTVDVRYRLCSLCSFYGHYEAECPFASHEDMYRIGYLLLPDDKKKFMIPNMEESYDVVNELCEGFLIEQSGTPSNSSENVAPPPREDDTFDEDDLDGFIVKAGITAERISQGRTIAPFVAAAPCGKAPKTIRARIGDLVAWNRSGGTRATWDVCVGTIKTFDPDTSCSLIRLQRIIPENPDVNCRTNRKKGSNKELVEDTLVWVPNRKIHHIDEPVQFARNIGHGSILTGSKRSAEVGNREHQRQYKRNR
jgi:hypothetical protein